MELFILTGRGELAVERIENNWLLLVEFCW